MHSFTKELLFVTIPVHVSFYTLAILTGWYGMPLLAAMF
jgi:hypothetical protein